MFSVEDLANLVQLLNRVQTTGIQEASVLIQLAQKAQAQHAELTKVSAVAAPSPIVAPAAS